MDVGLWAELLGGKRMEIVTRMANPVSIEPFYKETLLAIHIPNDRRAEALEKAYGLAYDPDALYTIRIEKRRKKRSLDANSYAWVLIGKLAEKLKTSPTIVYREIIKDCGTYMMAQVLPKAAERYMQVWEAQGLGWIAEDAGTSPKGNKYIRCFYGSSVYDSAEMSRLIDGLITECREQGIDTLTPAEIEELKRTWRA